MVRTRLISLLALVLALTLSPEASADLITPPGLLPGDEFRVVFLTDTVTAASSSSLSYYDSIVSGEAAAAGLATYNGSPVTWQAIVSTETTSAVSRLPADAVPIFLPDGTLVAAGGDALWSTGLAPGFPLDYPISEDAYGTVIGSAAFGPDVWTGTSWNGNTSAGGALGDSQVANGYINVGVDWIDSATLPAADHLPLYGFSSVLTVTPEPGGLTLALVAFGGWMGYSLIAGCRSSPGA
jgi:hypothetical protein